MRRTRLLLLTAAVTAFASSASAETLREALLAAYNNNPRLLAARAELRAIDENVPIALSGFRPEVIATSEVGARRIRANNESLISQDDEGGGSSGGGDQDLVPRIIAGQITQPLYRGGQTMANTRAAEHQVLSQRASLTGTEQTTLLSAATAYLDVVREQSVLDLNVRNEQRLRRQLDATRDRFQVGEVTRTDVSQAEARLSRATADRIGAEGVLQQSRATYRNVIGEAPRDLQAPGLPRILPASQEAALKAAVIANPAVVSATYNERAALDTVDVRKGELLPTVDLIGRVEQGYEEVREDAEVFDLQALLRVTIPIYQQGAEYARLRQAKQTVAQRRREIDQARNDVEEEATRAWTALETARSQVVAFNKEVEANALALEGVQREAEVGARTVLDVLDAEQELLTSQVDLVRANRDELVSAFQVLSAIGRLTVDTLDLTTDPYVPAVHYDQDRNRWFGGCSIGDICSDFAKPIRNR